MNAIDPELAGHASHGHTPLLPVRITGLGLLAAFVALAGLWATPIPGLHATRLLPIALASLTTALAGLAGAAILASARRRARDSLQIGRAARWPQALLVAPLAAAAVALAALSPFGPHPDPATLMASGAAAIVLAFPLLVAERCFAAIPAARLPEAQAIRRLLLVPVLAWPATGLIQIAGGLGVAVASRLDAALAILLAIIAAELALRAASRVFLPTPASFDARAAIDPLLPRLLTGLRAIDVSTPFRSSLGIDFSRSWALRFSRRAAPPIATVLGLVTWVLSGLVLIDTDSRAIYERFGAPVAVLGPGLHAILPWPMGQTRRLELGVLHEISPAGPMTVAAAPAGEGPAPPEADRLWEHPHPAEQVLLVASRAAGSANQQSFQVVSADIRLRYRIGMTDADAMRAIFAAAEPETLLRAMANRVIAGLAAGRTLEQLLGENRERLGETLRASIQSRLDADRTGLEVTAVVIEAIHPPSGAAAAYHAVQAAGILAATSVAAEHGRAAATLAHAAQYAASLITQSEAAGAEATARAVADTASFVADRDAAAAAPDSFMLERRLAALGAGLAKSTLTIVDRRISAVAPTIDLRPLTPSTAATAPPNAE